MLGTWRGGAGAAGTWRGGGAGVPALGTGILGAGRTGLAGDLAGRERAGAGGSRRDWAGAERDAAVRRFGFVFALLALRGTCSAGSGSAERRASRPGTEAAVFDGWLAPEDASVTFPTPKEAAKDAAEATATSAAARRPLTTPDSALVSP